MFKKDIQYVKFCSYGFLKNLRFFEPFLILFFREAGISFLQIGFLFTIRAVAVNIMEIPSGMIADGIGRRRAMVLSFLSYILSFLLFYLTRSYYIFIPAMILFAMGEAFRTGTHKAMILDYLNYKGWKEYRTYYYGHTRSWSQRGSAISALIAAGLVFYSGNYRSVFLFTLIPYILELALMLSYPAWLDGLHKEDEKLGLIKFTGLIFKEMKTAFINPDLRRSFLSSSIPSGFFESIKDYIQPLLAVFALSLPFLTGVEDKQGTALVTGVIYSLIFLLTSIASGASGSFSNRFGSVKKQLNITYLAGMGLIITAGLLFHMGFIIPSICIFITYYFLQNLRRPVTVGFLSDQIDDRLMATGLSADSQLKTLWVALLSPLIGLISDKISLGGAIAITGILGLILLPFAKLSEKEKRE
ncbi:MAG: MFS transporter [Spirochaetales bacterium]|nr:MFS transporter [Spirochaetales bacterium]